MKKTLSPFSFLAGLLVLGAPFHCFSDTVGTTGVQFLEVPTGVRGAGMGNTFAAIADDVTTTYWNTAGLANLDKLEFNALYVSYLASINYGFGGVAIPIQPGSTIGLSAAFDFVPTFNSTNNPLATPGSANDLALSLGFGQSLGDNLDIGIGGKFISSNLVTYSATGEAVDAGVLIHTKQKDLTLGLSVQNVGQISNFTNYSAQEKLPLIYRAGIAYRFQPKEPTHFVIGVDVEKPIDSDPIYHAGGELWVGDKTIAAAFRAGYSLNALNQDLGGTTGASLGAGVKITSFELNYALVPFGVLGDTQRFSVTWRLEPGEEGGSAQAQKIKMNAIAIKPQISDLQTGTLRQATFDVKPQARTDIKNWSLDITDRKGNLLRTISGKGVPPKQISWDGRDANGNVVNGGLYANYNFRTIDARGQEVSASNAILKVAEVSEREAPMVASVSANARIFSVPSLQAEVRPTSGVIKPPSITFDGDKDRLSPAFYNYLDKVAKLIRKHPTSRIYLEGHAYQEGTEQKEQSLSQNRADSVLRYLVEKGKVSPDNLYSRGHGSTSPIDTSDTEEARSKNRRVDIVILAK